MRTRRLFQIFLALSMLALASLACMAPTEEIVTPEPAVNTPVPNQPSIPTGSGNSLSQDQISYLAHATVRIWGVKVQGNEYTPIYVGSGTIISPDGLILTNCHVANPVAMGMDPAEGPDALVIDLIQTEDKPPVSTYIAEIAAYDPTLDLAVLRVSQTLKGAAVNPQSLNLPTVPLGNSDNVKLGERLFIFGYPAIGGQTLTYSTGDVAGFDSDTPVGDRAWIKTEAAISGGNSGGLAANARGEIIGIPTQIGTGTAVNRVDCRVISDTNGDGTIDGNDTCIPAGGFINGVRPVNWSLPLIDAARNYTVYSSPYGDPLANVPQRPQNPQQPANQGGGPQLNLVTWTDQEDENHCPVNPLDAYPSGTTEVIAVFSFTGFSQNEHLAYTWVLDNEEVASNTTDWTGGPDGDCFAFSLANGGEALPDGSYTVNVYGGQPEQLVAQATTTIGGAPAPANNSDEGVIVSGTITDANTGRPIKGALVVVLKPGVDPVDWTGNPDESQVLGLGETTSKGEYIIAAVLNRGESYGVVAGNNKLGYPPITGFLNVDANSEAMLTLDLELSK